MNPAGSQEIDRTWDGWMDTLSTSYIKTTALRADGKTSASADEYRTGVAAVVRKIYTEVASTPPARFEKIGADLWTAWARKLYANIRQTEDVLAGRTEGDVAKLLDALRQHFHVLHEQAGALKSNDCLYAFRRAAAAEKIDAAALAKLKEQVDGAVPSRKAKAEAAAYTQAKDEWSGAVGPILADGKVEPAELESLRKASEKFYRQFGIQIE